MPKEKIALMIEGGKATAGAEIGQKLGPLKINIQTVLSSINEKTSSFSGMQVPVKLIVDTQDKSYTIEVGSPPVSQLVKKELALEKGSAMPNLNKVANLAMEQVIKIAIMKKDAMLVKNLKAAIKSVIGTCNSLGILVEGKEAKQIIEDINNGLYDDLIKAEKTSITDERKEQLAAQLKEVQLAIQKEQERLKALEEAEKKPVAAAEEAAPTAEAAAETAPVAGKQPAGKEAAKPEAKAAEKKPAEKEAKKK